MRFRVWDKVNEKMIYPESNGEDWFAIDQRGVLARMHCSSVLGGELLTEVMKDSEAVAMFSTGYRDMNGKEIYVEDVIRAELARQKIFHIKSLADMEIQIDHSGSYLGASEHDETEIIGNIWENPELKGDTDGT